MPETSKFDLYISYNNKDEELISKLAKDLVANGINTIFDKNILRPGENWKEKLTQALTNADAVLTLLTPNSISGGYVMSELGLAQGLGKLILPVIYGGIPIPEFVKDIQVIFWAEENYEDVIETITRTINNLSKVKNKREQNDKNSEPTLATRNYWLFKMKANTWEPWLLNQGDSTFFNTHFFGKKRPEYELFNEIGIGDLVLGFGTDNYPGIFCLQEVIEPVGPNTAQGEGFQMVIKRLIKPIIGDEKLKNIIPELLSKLAANKKPPELFFRISKTDFETILATDEFEQSYENVYQPFYLTEGNHKETVDQLDFENDINSFATVIALQKVDPPLAIGLFGNWGSGKSFFMEKLSKRIEEISESKEADYITNVVQVKFNSWHYSDANLWASLITQIFESLHDYATKKQFGADAIKAIYKDLNITSQQLEETQKKLDANAIQETAILEKKASVEETIQLKKDRLDIWKARDFIKIVFSDPYIQDDFENIKTQFKNDGLIDNLNQIDEKLSTIDTGIDRLTQSFVLLKNNNKGNWKWVWVLALLFATVAWLVMGPLNGFIKDIVKGVYIASGLFIVWLGNLIVKLTPYIKKVTNFYNRLKSLKEKIDIEKENVRLKEHDEVDRLQKDLAALATKKATLEQQQTRIAETKLKLETEIKEIGSGKLLANFLAGKSTDDAYIKQLGIISWVRKDFVKLNDIFHKQKTIQLTEKDLQVEVQIDRIVLYIDDLDRCNEDVVVKVLEAIHLLLAFPLFVVIVGVDPRWLNNALSEKYKTLFGYTEEKKVEKGADVLFQSSEDNAVLTGVATSYDYLEKIFQIPFALKPINRTGREKLIKYLVREEMVVEKDSDKQNKDVQSDISQPKIPTEVNEQSPRVEKNEDETKTQTDEEKIKSAKRAKERLVFTADELRYMQKISSLFGHTPRTINRYVNIYRIIKAHGNLKVVGNFSKEEFMPIMFILGVIVGSSAFAEKFIDEISNADNGDEFMEFIDKSKLDEKLKTLIKPLSTDIEKILLKDFKRNIELIARFSFRTLI